MAMTVLPPFGIQPRLAYAYTLTLGGVVVSYRLRWDDVSASWYLDIDDAAGAAIMRGARVCGGCVYGARTRDVRLPGRIVCEDTAGGDTDPTWDSLGSQHLLVWVAP